MPMGLPDDVIQAYLKELHLFFAAGDKAALFNAIRFCGNEQVIMPEWVVDAFFKATNAWYSYSVKTLDEAFGVVWPKGKHVNAAKKKRIKMFSVLNIITEESRKGNSINMELFEKIANQLGINKTDAINYYSTAKGIVQQPHTFDVLLEPYKAN